MTDAREAIYELVDAWPTHDVEVYYRLTPDFADQIPAVHIYLLGGSETDIDRTDRVGVDVYATGTEALQVANELVTYLAGPHEDLAAGVVDDVWTENLPADVPYAGTPNLAQATYRVVTRH